MEEEISPPGGELVFDGGSNCDSVKTAAESTASAGPLIVPIAIPILAIPTSGLANSECWCGQRASSCEGFWS